MADGPFLLRLYASTRIDITMLPLLPSEKEQLVATQFAAQRHHYATYYPDAEHSIVLVMNAPAGRLYLNRDPDEYRIVDLSLLPESRGHGIGTDLLTRILEGARSVGAPVRLHVEHLSPARRLYDRMGFVALSETESHCFMEWSGRKLKTDW